ncbi:TfoX/Sxy family DNA transformation protein [Thomasclavelia sp.]
MKSLDGMLNIGKEMKTKLISIGVASSEDLIRLGSKEVFYQLKEQYPNVCLVHLYALQGAIDNIDYDKLSDEVKLDLKQFSDSIKGKWKCTN